MSVNTVKPTSTAPWTVMAVLVLGSGPAGAQSQPSTIQRAELQELEDVMDDVRERLGHGTDESGEGTAMDEEPGKTPATARGRATQEVVTPAPKAFQKNAGPTREHLSGHPPAESIQPGASASPAVSPLQLPRDPRTGLYLLNAGFDLAPWAGTSTLVKGRDMRKLSLGLFGTYSGAVTGLELSTGLNITRHRLDGLQAAGGANLVLGQAHGLQAAGGANVVIGAISGLQAAGGANVVTGDQDGFQAAGGANIVLGSADGLQAAGGANVVAGDINGFQGAGGANITTGTVKGLQIAGGANIAGAVDSGGQVAGGVNIALGDVKGVQIGAINIAENADAAVGVFNLMYRGRWAMDAWAGDSGFARVALVNGARYTHSVLHVGVQPLGRRQVWAAGFGLGGHLPVTDSLSVDVDALVSALRSHTPGDETWDTDDEDAWRNEGGILGTARGVIRWRLARAFGVFCGLTYNVLASESENLKGGRFAALRTNRVRERKDDGSNYDPSVWVWPGLEAGIRIHIN